MTVVQASFGLWASGLFTDKVILGEECDDMNSVNGDGCSSQCKKEPFFNCVGKSYR